MSETEKPKWQTGPIPEPDGPAVLYKRGTWFPVLIADLDPNNSWYWYNPWKDDKEIPQYDQWCIQKATLPAPTVSGESEQ